LKQRKVITVIMLIIICSTVGISIFNQAFITDISNQGNILSYSFTAPDKSGDGPQNILILLVLTTLLGLLINFLINIINGLMPVNYQQIFKAANINLQIFNHDFSSVYKARGATPIDMKMKKMLAEQVNIKDFPIKNYLLLSAQPVKEGYAVWQKDISNLCQLKEVLSTISCQISDDNELLENESKRLGRYWGIKWENSICEELATAVNNEMIKIEKLLNALPQIEKNENFRYTKCEIIKLDLLICYIKRKSNLLLIGRQNGMILIADLAQACTETLHIAEAAGVEGAVNIPQSGEISLEIALILYDFSHQLLEQLIGYKKSYIFWQIVLRDKTIKLIIFFDIDSEESLRLGNITLSEKLLYQIKTVGGIVKTELEDDQYNMILELPRGDNVGEQYIEINVKRSFR